MKRWVNERVDDGWMNEWMNGWACRGMRGRWAGNGCVKSKWEKNWSDKYMLPRQWVDGWVGGRYMGGKMDVDGWIMKKKKGGR